MNSNNLSNLEEYVFSLEKKRDVELPQELLQIDEEIKKLRERRTDVLKTIKDVTLEIDYLKGGPRLKSLMDVPPKAWRLIQQCCIREQNFGILDLCLASPTLDQIIKGNSTSKTLSITGEKVFRLLLENCYLDENDIRSCLNSNAKDLQSFVGSNWVYGNISIVCGLRHDVEFRSTAELTDFEKIANQSKQKWKLFAFKRFTFDAELCKTGEKYEEFWNTVLNFVKTYGNFLLRVSLLDGFIGAGMKGMCKDLFLRLPRIQYFYASINCWDEDDDDEDALYSYLILQSADRIHGHGANHSLDFRHTISRSCPFLEDVGPHCQTWSVDRENLAQISPEVLSPNICRNLKTLILEIPAELGEGWSRPSRGYQVFMDADLTNVANVETLLLTGESQSIKWFALLEKFPHAKTIEFRGRKFRESELPPQPNVPSQLARFPAVTKMIVDIKPTYLPLSLDRVPQLLPSLVQLTIKCSHFNKADFAAQLLKAFAKDADFQRENKIIDVYRIYGERRSLSDSNIWRYMRNLSRIVVETVAEYRERNDGTGIPNHVGVRKEIFSRPI